MKNLSGDNQASSCPLSSPSASDVRKQVSNEKRLNAENVDAGSTHISKTSIADSSKFTNKGVRTETAKESEDTTTITETSNSVMDTMEKNARKSGEISNWTGDDENEGSGSENFH